MLHPWKGPLYAMDENGFAWIRDENDRMRRKMEQCLLDERRNMDMRNVKDGKGNERI